MTLQVIFSLPNYLKIINHGPSLDKIIDKMAGAQKTWNQLERLLGLKGAYVLCRLIGNKQNFRNQQTKQTRDRHVKQNWIFFFFFLLLLTPQAICVSILCLRIFYQVFFFFESIIHKR